MLRFGARRKGPFSNGGRRWLEEERDSLATPGRSEELCRLPRCGEAGPAETVDPAQPGKSAIGLALAGELDRPLEPIREDLTEEAVEASEERFLQKRREFLPYALQRWEES